MAGLRQHLLSRSEIPDLLHHSLYAKQGIFNLEFIVSMGWNRKTHFTTIYHQADNIFDGEAHSPLVHEMPYMVFPLLTVKTMIKI